MYRKKILSSIVFFLFGVFLFWIVYRDFNISELMKGIHEIKYLWIIIAVFLGLVSHFLRAVRWKMLLDTMNYEAGKLNLFLSVIVLYFTNLIIPRGGEITRCAVVSKYEKIPFVKLVGTVFLERITDLFAFILIFLILLVLHSDFFITVFNYSDFKLEIPYIEKMYLPLISVAILIVLIIILLYRLNLFNKICYRLKNIKNEFMEGVTVIIHMKTRIKFFLITLIIFLFWLLMLYSVFFAYPPTEHLSFIVAVLTYTFGTLAYLLPIQAGIGAWHFIVMSCLFFYGIDKESGLIFALIAHTFTNLIFLAFGPLAMALLPLVNSKSKSLKN